MITPTTAEWTRLLTDLVALTDIGDVADLQHRAAELLRRERPAMVTIQYEVERPGGKRLGSTAVREKTFQTEEALVKWADKNADRIKILRYSR